MEFTLKTPDGIIQNIVPFDVINDLIKTGNSIESIKIKIAIGLVEEYSNYLKKNE